MIEQRFVVHKGVVCFYSGFFDRCFNGEFAEAKRGAVDIEDEEVEIFKHFVNWVYTRQLPLTPTTQGGGCSNTEFDAISRLWVLADRREVPLLANCCLDGIREISMDHDLVPATQLNYAYENTPEKSGLRRFMIFLIAYTGSKTLFDQSNKYKWNEESLWDVLQLVWDRDKSDCLTDKELRALDMCGWHIHADEKEKV